MANVNWAGAFDGLFGDALDWVGGLVPTKFDNAFLDVTGPAITVLAESGLLNDVDDVINTIQTSTKATLEIVGGESLIDDLLGVATKFTDIAGTGLTGNLGTIAIKNNLVKNLLGSLTGASADFDTNGLFKNVGKIEIAAEPALLTILGDAQAVFSVQKSLKLTGGGIVSLTSSLNNVIEGDALTSVLYNVNNTIIGAGLLGNGNLKLVNELAGSIVGGSATVEMIIDTGTNTILNAGLIKNTNLGGVLVKSKLDNTGVLANSRGVMTVDQAVSGTGKAEITGGTINFLSTFKQDVSFGAAGALELAKSTTYTGAISGFSKTGKTALDLDDITYGKSTKATYSGTVKGGVLTVTDGSHTSHLDLVGNYLGETFKTAADGTGGTKITAVVAKSTAASTQSFVSAMAGMGASSAAAGGSHEDAGLHQSAMLAKPGVQQV